MAVPERELVLEGAFNVRDLGGYPTADGSRVRWRRLFRSDSLHRLSEDDVAEIASLGIATVIDLRTGGEVDQRGAFPGEGTTTSTTYRHLPLIARLTSSDDMGSIYVDPDRVTARYLEILHQGSGQMREVLTLLSDGANYPALFHCTAGRDRTGVVAATVLGLLGVPDEDIVADYVLSRHAMTRMLDRLRADYPDAREELDRQAPGLLSLFGEAMAALLVAVREGYGSFDGYAAAIGIPGAAEALRAVLVD